MAIVNCLITLSQLSWLVGFVLIVACLARGLYLAMLEGFAWLCWKALLR